MVRPAVAEAAIPHVSLDGASSLPGHKQTECGIVPNGWEVKPLGDVISLQRGHDLTARQRKPGLVPVMGSAGQNGFHDTALVRGPGVVVGRSGASFGQAHYCETDFWPHNTAMYVTDFWGNDPLFVYYFLKSIDFSRHNSGGAQQSLNRNFIYPIIVAIPQLSEQRLIAEAFRNADTFIERLERLTVKKRQIKHGAMQGLLTGKRRLPAFHEKWGEQSFSDIFDFYPTAANSRADLGDDGDTYYIHYGDIHTRFHNHLNFALAQPSRIARAKCRNAALVRNGDWIMADASEDYDGVGKSIEILGLLDNERAVSGLHTFLLREKEQTFAPGFKGHLGNLRSLHDQYMRVMTGMKVFGVSKSALRDLVLPVPPTDEQESIVDVLDDMDAEIAALEVKLAKARDIKQGMTQELLTGRLRLV